MPQVKTAKLLFVGFLTLTASFIGCSDPNAQSPINSDTGSHAANWLPAAHMAAATSDLDSCSTCHGADFNGGISGVSCTSCHLGSSTSVHPATWVPVYSTHGPYATANGTNACSNQYCHGPSLTGVPNSGPSCTSCHLGSPTSVHPADWVPVYSTHGPYVKANSTSACANQYCHGLSLTGVANSGPSCTLCHLGGLTSGHPADWVPIYSTHGPYATANGTNSCSNQYCHGPSLTGVPNSGPSCTSCHLGSPTSVHPADWVPVYSTHGPYVKANSTSACANQYCHGLSLTGVANSGPSCTSCHLGGLTSGHPADWVPIYSTHGPYVTANGTNSCSNQYCHGTTLTGVPDSGPSCTLCHLGTPTSVHPTDWVPVYSTHGPYVNTNPTGTSACANQYCHGPSLAGVPDSGPSCTSCHMGGVTNIHPAGWLGDACTNHGNYALTNGTTGCANIYCHGATLGGVPQSGPSCTKCHPTIPTSPSCGTCHGIPPAGTAYPNIAGKHAKHMALNGVTCTTCHNRSCDQHMNGTVDVIFNAAYNAKSGTGSFNTTAKTCSEVSCHGGPRTQTLAQLQSNQSTTSQTPDWYTGTITVNSQCDKCHIYGTTEYNSYFSGKHFKHLGGDAVIYADCLDCHDTIKLANPAVHFANLNTNVISAGTASATTWWWLNYNGTTCTYAGCHQGETRTWW
jgi:predicted CxxxxCH...CXXCH cytochrome family protein